MPRSGRARSASTGQSILGLPPYHVARAGVVLVPERRKIFETLSVWDNLRLAHGQSATGAAWRPRSSACSRSFPDRLPSGGSRLAGYLSGGERQMLAIAQGLLCEPKLLLVDELSLGLAPHLVKELMAAARRAAREFGISILLIEQDARSALAIADYGYIMEGGRIVYEGRRTSSAVTRTCRSSISARAIPAASSYRDVKQYRRSRRWWG